MGKPGRQFRRRLLRLAPPVVSAAVLSAMVSTAASSLPGAPLSAALTPPPGGSFADDRLAVGIEGGHQLQRLVAGQQVERMSLSRDGGWLAWTVVTGTNVPKVRLMQVAGGRVLEFTPPAGELRGVVLITSGAGAASPLKVGAKVAPQTPLVLAAVGGKGSRTPGLFGLDPGEGAGAGWRLAMAGGFHDLAVDGTGSRLALTSEARTGVSDRQLWVYRVAVARGAGGRGAKGSLRLGAGQRLAGGLQGIITAPAFSDDGRRIYFGFTALRDDGFRTGLYAVDRQRGASARPALLAERVGAPVPVPRPMMGLVLAMQATAPAGGEEVAVAASHSRPRPGRGDLLLVSQEVLRQGHTHPHWHLWLFDTATRALTPWLRCSLEVACRMPVVDQRRQAVYFQAYESLVGPGAGDILSRRVVR